jgi:hypothetical protein
MMTAKKKQNDRAAASAGGSETNSNNLTVEDVLKILEEDGIRDLQQFVKRELRQTKASRQAQRRASLLGPAPSKPSARGKAQRPITVPILIDGVLYDPKDIHRFDGQILHFVAPSATRPFQAFTGDQWPTAVRTFIQYRNVTSILQLENVEEGGPYPPPGGGGKGGNGGGPVIYPGAEFFSDINFSGDHLFVDHGRERSDLTQIGRGDFWDRHTWNDCICSVGIPVPKFGFVVLCEDINLGGASHSVPDAVTDLTPFGWNNRASSIVFW